MYKLAKPFFMKVITPLHAGSGQDLGIVDLPIQREKHTGFPKVEASGIKGSIREVFEEKIGRNSEKISAAFGPEGGDAHAGALGFTDARILLFPVKSLKGIFAYITCSDVLKRFENDLKVCGLISNIGEIKENSVASLETVAVNKNNKKGNIILEEYSFEVEEDDNTKKLAEWLSNLLGIDEIKERLVILSNDDFKDFVNLSTEVITRTRINNETGTVKSGALFTEEYLPAETILYSLALTTPLFNKDKGIFDNVNGDKEEEKVMNFFLENIPDIIQIGGNATIGKGIVEIKKWKEVNNG